VTVPKRPATPRPKKPDPKPKPARVIVRKPPKATRKGTPAANPQQARVVGNVDEVPPDWTPDYQTPHERKLEHEITVVAKSAKAGGKPGGVPKAIREFVAQHLATKAAVRLYRIGMGIEHFPTPFVVQRPGFRDEVVVKRLPAPPTVQKAALTTIVDIALPKTTALTNADGTDLPETPGVVALPQLGLDAARELQRRQQAAQALPEGAQQVSEDAFTVAAPPSGSQSWEQAAAAAGLKLA
jgi:hypothetical protein